MNDLLARLNAVRGLALASLIGVCILIGLGTWQLQRREWKLDLIAAVEARAYGEPAPLGETLRAFRAGEDVRYTRITTRGRFRYGDDRHVFGTLGGQPGYFVFTPFMPAETPAAFYVNRGFITQTDKTDASRDVPRSGMPVKLVGLFREAEEKPFLARIVSPPPAPEANQYYTRDPARFSVGVKKSVSDTDYYVDAFEIAGDDPGPASSAPRPGTTKLAFNNRHLQYAFTWYGLALTLIGVFIAVLVRPGDEKAGSEDGAPLT